MQIQRYSEISHRTLRLVTKGRITGLSHVVELRYIEQNGMFLVLAGNKRSDWVHNAMQSGIAKARLGANIYQVLPRQATLEEARNGLDGFRRKYGSRIVNEWYQNSPLCILLEPIGAPENTAAGKGETQPEIDFLKWKQKGLNYYESVRQAFDQASEEYDYTISHNYINTWIRERSLNELISLTEPNDLLLEIGCGTGAEAIRMSKHVAKIVATDISEKMIRILKVKIQTRHLEEKIVPVKIAASQIATINDTFADGKFRIAYSLNGALNCEPNLESVPEQLSKVIQPSGHFICSIRNPICLSEDLSHSIVLQFSKTAPRKNQPVMVSVGGLDIPSFYYTPRRFVEIFRPYFSVKRIVGLPAFLPPAYLNDYYLRVGRAKSFFEKLEELFAHHFPFNQFGDQTLFVFRRRE